MGSFNYFNYFTEIEEYFWRKRGAHLLVSPLDWAIVETWQKAGIPLEAVLKGIDRAFESFERSRRGAGGRTLKSLAYCTEAVTEAAEEVQEAAAGKSPRSGATAKKTAETFSRQELRAYFDRNLSQLEQAAQKCRQTSPELGMRFDEARKKLAELLPRLDSPAAVDLEDLERVLTVHEEKLAAGLFAAAPEQLLLEIRREMDRQLAPYRRKMTAEQLSLLERQYTLKRLFENFELPRLSLFYLV